MQGVRAGNLQLPAARKFTDEVGETQQEFERLVIDLETAKTRAERELEARRRVERGLQDADKLITLGQLSAIMAHEVGSPLQVLEGRARALRKHANDSTATVRTADLIIEQVERITRIVGQVLAITRRRPSMRRLIDAEASVRGVIALLELEAKRLDVDLTFRRTGPTNVVADSDQLQQVALNLIRNALQASPAHSSIVVSLGGDESQLVLEVQDHGPGIPQAVRPRLFEPFFTTRADSGGTGLGLSVVKRIVLDHQGRIEFVEGAAPGCLVRVEIPRKLELESA
jgi:signal transduction histidine kinase